MALNVDFTGVMKEVRQTGFPIVLVFFLGMGGHHWATRYFDEVIVVETKAKVALIEGVAAVNAENAKNLARAAEALERLAPRKAAGVFERLGLNELAAAAEVNRPQGQGHNGDKAAVEPNAARFDFGQHGTSQN